MARSYVANGDALRRIRDAKWLNQGELAEMSQVSRQTISRIESGKSPYPTRSTIKQLARALDVHPDELVNRT